MDNLINAHELHAYIEDEIAPTIIDVRAPEAYNRGHLPGAVNIPIDQISGAIDIIPFNRPIVTYCNMHNPGSSGSENAAEILTDAGLHARALKGGYPEWVDAHFPIDMEEHTLSQDWTARHRA